jgi:hypothetical protein
MSTIINSDAIAAMAVALFRADDQWSSFHEVVMFLMPKFAHICEYNDVMREVAKIAGN